MRDIVLTLPAVALRGITILPNAVTHFDVSRAKSIAAVEQAMVQGQQIFLVGQKNPENDGWNQEDLFAIGVVATIRQVVRLQKDLIRVIVVGQSRAKLYGLSERTEYLEADLICYEEEELDKLEPMEKEAMVESIRDSFSSYALLHGKIGGELVDQVGQIRDLAKLIDFVTNNLPVDFTQKQTVLEALPLGERYYVLSGLLERQAEISKIKNELQRKTKERVDKHQKDYVLREQMGVIKKELGEDDLDSELADYQKSLEGLTCSQEIRDRIQKELAHLKRVSGSSSESAVSRGYIETLLALPWDKKTQDNEDLKHAQQILDQDHYGLEDVKERILDYLAVRKLTGQAQSPILCLVGPPGTGKTSIARSIAKALNKNYVRICLGGVRDEAEIRGHRKTYVGAMPGRIIAGLKQAGSANPLMLLDEIDKAGSDHKGDTASALLEVLDGEQNTHFQDHYLELPVDLSQVLFLCTANSLADMQKPLLDRMEVIEISSYTANEKLHIAKEHLLERQRQANGLEKKQLSITDSALKEIIDGYTREAGVRGLERNLGKICRKCARKIYEGQADSIRISGKNLEDYLGKRKYQPLKKNSKNQVGLVRGLAWTAVGGVTLEIEVNVMPGKGELKLTGQMGDVMKESALIALSLVRSLSGAYGIPEDFFAKHDLHLHIPEGATPKDGPSAGVTMTTAILSAVTGIPVEADLAMTGEITLRGRVLAIGGLKEKLLAAKTAGISKVCLPKENQKDLEEISLEIKEGMELVLVDQMDQVLKEALAGKRQE